MDKRKTTNLAFTKQLLRFFFNVVKFNNLRILWVGDSHAISMRSGLRLRLDQNKPIESLLYWLGPRLMYSVSKSGFPTSLFFQFSMRFWKPRFVIVSLGEIDVRMFLHNPHLRNSQWVLDYLYKVLELCNKLNLRQIYLLTSIPVSNLPPLDPIERVGSTEDRLNGFDWLQNQIDLELRSNRTFSKIHLLDLFSCLNGPDGTLSSKFSDDGIHVNSAGAWQVWGTIFNQFSD